MTAKEGRIATRPYRVRAGGVWYWVDPTVPPADIEPDDTVVIYPRSGEATLAILKSEFRPGEGASAVQPVAFSTLEGERFEIPAHDIATLHLAAVDEQQ